MMTKKYLILFLVLFSISILRAEDINIRYLSANHVYLNSGKTAGISVGCTFTVWRNNESIGLLKAIYVSEHSTSCEIISQQTAMQPGDIVKITKKPSKDSTTVELPAITNQVQKKNTSSVDDKDQGKTRIKGYFSMSWRQAIDETEAGSGYLAPQVRLKLKVDNIGGGNWSLQIRGRSRYFERQNKTSLQIPATEWRHRLYMASFLYHNPVASYLLQVGRIISNEISGAGYVDGILLEYQPGEFWRWGVIGGFQPDNKTSGFNKASRKAGLYVSSKRRRFQDWTGSVNLAALGEYIDEEISREYLYMRASLSHGSLFSLYNSVELDLNRGWRKERTGNSVSLTSLYVNAGFQFSEQLSTQISYDNRKNYYSYEYYSLADSLFDDAFRHGGKIRIGFKPQKNMRFSLYSGLRKRDNEDRITYSYGGNAAFSRIPLWELSFFLRAAGFSNLYIDGITAEAAISKSFYRTGNLRIAYGGYRYKNSNNNLINQNPWVKIGYHTDLPFKIFVNLDGEYNFGDDLRGYQFYGELGYRF